jgi:hypothetical protein
MLMPAAGAAGELDPVLCLRADVSGSGLASSKGRALRWGLSGAGRSPCVEENKVLRRKLGISLQKPTGIKDIWL